MTAAQLLNELDGLDATRNLADARRLAVLGEWDHRGGPAVQGAVSPASALEYRHGRDSRGLRSDVTLARKLRLLPAVRPAERDRFGFFFLLAAILSVAQTLGLAGTEALFLKRLGADHLPIAFIFASQVPCEPPLH